MLPEGTNRRFGRHGSIQIESSSIAAIASTSRIVLIQPGTDLVEHIAALFG
jgi:hypothetical protein